MEEKPTELPVSEQEVQIQAPSLLDKIKIHKLKILGGILGVLILVGVVFGAYKLGQRQVQPVPQPTPTPAAVATPTSDPTADWKTYTNTKYGYLIRYPEKWLLFAPEACIPSCPEAADNMSIVRPPEVKYPEGDFSVTSWTESFEPQVLDKERSKSEARSWNWKSRREQTIKVGGYEGWSIVGEMEFGDNKLFSRRYMVVKTSSGLWEINLWDTKEQIYKDTFNLILSTFKFLE